MQEVTGSTPVSSTTLIVCEDRAERAFASLTGVRGVFDLRCGARTLLERLQQKCGAGPLVLLARPEMTALLQESHPEAVMAGPGQPPRTCAFVNGRLLALGHDLQRLLQAPGTFAACAGESLVAGRCSGSQIPQLIEALQADVAAPREPVTSRLARIAGLEIRNLESGWARDGSRLLAHAWELCESNGTALRDDFEGAGIDARARVDPGVHLLVPESIRIESGARLRPGVVLDAESGPITIAAGADLQAHVVIRGPAWIGPGCLLKTGTAIQGDTSLGPVCKVGGEIGGSILQGFANKQHEGYLGHAFLGEWVNLGADTTNSDLKNNYGSVRMWEDGRFVDTGLLFVGLVAADHVKTAINTQLNTGTVLGLASQVAGPGFPPKYVPPFSWCSPRGIEVYDFERALRTARTVMARRERELTPAYAAALRRVFAAARDEKR